MIQASELDPFILLESENELSRRARQHPGSILPEFYPRYVRLPGQYQILKGNPVPCVSGRQDDDQ